MSALVLQRPLAARITLSPLTRALLGRPVRTSSLPVGVQLAAMCARLRGVFGAAPKGGA